MNHAHAARAYGARRDRRHKRMRGQPNSGDWPGIPPHLPPAGRQILMEAGPPALAPRNRLPPHKKGWDFLLGDNLKALAGRSALADEVRQRLLQLDSSRTGAARSSPRARAREHRRCTQRKLEVCCEAALDWLSTGGLCAQPRPPEQSTATRRWEQALKAASRTSPFDCKEDVRGRSRELLDAILSGNASEPTSSSPLGSGIFGYNAFGQAAANLDIIGSRPALPPQAALLPLRPWLCEKTGQAWEQAGDFSDIEPPRAYFAATQREWRCAVRRMARSGLGRAISSSSCPPGLAAGAFAVPKDIAQDRLIGDRRPQNAGERMPGPVRLPYAPRLRRLRLQPEQCLWVGKRDLSNCFYLFAVDEARLARQVIGPRIPRAWLADIEDETLDLMDEFPSWWAADLGRAHRAEARSPDDRAFCQFAITGVMMGDIGAVTVIQEAHSRLLLSGRVLRPSELVGGSPFLGDLPLAGDVYIDDLVLMAVGEACRPPPELLERLSRADQLYQHHGLPTKAEKGCTASTDSTFWGASLRGREGLLGFSLERRAALAATTLVGLTCGMSGQELMRMLGVWTFAAGFRREALAVLGSAFILAREMPPHRRVRPSGPVLDELLALVGLFPLMYADLRTDCLRDERGRPLVYATDAEGEGGLGGCETTTDDVTWNRLYGMAEEKGEYVRLDWTDAQPQPSAMTDRRAGAAAFAITSEWKVAFRFPASSCPELRAGLPNPHINVLELRAVLALARRLVARGARDARIIILIDSRVGVGALGKGRSSSRRLNRVLRQLAAIGLRSGLTFDVIWIPTWANPSDAPSRGTSLYVWRSTLPDVPVFDLFRRSADPADKDLWERILGPSGAAPHWDPEYNIFYPAEEIRSTIDEGSSRRSRGDEPRAHSVIPEPPANPPVLPPRDPCPIAAPPPSWTAGAAPRHSDAPSWSSPSREPSCADRKLRMTRRERRAGRRFVNHALRRGASVRQQGGVFLEVFCGTGRLTRAVGRCGCRVAPGIDLLKGPRKIDLCNDQAYLDLVKEVFTQRVSYVHLGTPCTTFSSALRGKARKRSKCDPVGPESDPKIAAANLLSRRTVSLCRLIAQAGGFWSIENPNSSLLWHLPEVARLVGQGSFVRFDACAYGARIPGEGAFRKRTKLLTNMLPLRGLERRCTCTEPHVELKGKTRVAGRWVNRTQYASEYTQRLVYKWAALARPHLVPRLSRALTSWKRLALLLAGDVEPNPGPLRTRRGTALPISDLLVGMSPS